MPSPEQPVKRDASRSLEDGLRVGDAVAYSRTFLRSIGAFTGDLPHAKGTITGLVAIGREVVLAEVAWDRAELPGRVNVKNLCLVGSRAYLD